MDPFYPGTVLTLYSAMYMLNTSNTYFWIETCTLSTEFSSYHILSKISLLMIYEAHDSKIYTSPWVPESHILFQIFSCLFYMNTLSIPWNPPSMSQSSFMVSLCKLAPPLFPSFLSSISSLTWTRNTEPSMLSLSHGTKSFP